MKNMKKTNLILTLGIAIVVSLIACKKSSMDNVNSMQTNDNSTLTQSTMVTFLIPEEYQSGTNVVDESNQYTGNTVVNGQSFTVIINESFDADGKIIAMSASKDYCDAMGYTNNVILENLNDFHNYMTSNSSQTEAWRLFGNEKVEGKDKMVDHPNCYPCPATREVRQRYFFGFKTGQFFNYICNC